MVQPTTTRTYSFKLDKYTRARPISQAQPTATSTPNWDPPVRSPGLQADLDMTESELERSSRLRLRIVYRLPGSGPATVYEDLDLSSFSELDSHLRAMKPLKAIYNANQVQIRYLDVLSLRGSTSASQPAFNRFQIAFSSTEDASDFVKHIMGVCPCTPPQCAAPPPSSRAATSSRLAPSASSAAPPPSQLGRPLEERTPTRKRTAAEPARDALATPSSSRRRPQNSTVESPGRPRGRIQPQLESQRREESVVDYASASQRRPAASPGVSRHNSHSYPPQLQPRSIPDVSSLRQHQLINAPREEPEPSFVPLSELTPEQLEAHATRIVQEPGFGDLLDRVRGMAAVRLLADALREEAGE